MSRILNYANCLRATGRDIDNAVLLTDINVLNIRHILDRNNKGWRRQV